MHSSEPGSIHGITLKCHNTSVANYISGHLGPASESSLLALAVAGLASVNPLRLERVLQITPRTERLGWQYLAAGLGHIISAPNASNVLRGSYLSQLHRRAMPLAG